MLFPYAPAGQSRKGVYRGRLVEREVARTARSSAGDAEGVRVALEDAMKTATSPHDFKLLLESAGRRGTTMADVLEVPPTAADEVARAA